MEDLVLTSGVVRRHVTNISVYRPEEGRANVVFNITKPVVIYKKDENDESVPTESTQVKVYLKDIRDAVNADRIPYMNILISQGGYSKAVLSAFADSNVDFVFTPFEEGDEYIDADGETQTHEHKGVNITIKFASLKIENVKLVFDALIARR